MSQDEEDEKPASKAPAKKPQPRKSGAQATAKSARDSDAMEVEEEVEFGDVKKWMDLTSWEHLVHHIDTVEKNPDGTLYVYFQL